MSDERTRQIPTLTTRPAGAIPCVNQELKPAARYSRLSHAW